MSNLDKIVTLVMGDWSGDGHDKTARVSIMSNLNKKEIVEAYKEGTKKLGFDFTAEVAEEYEDSKISSEKLDILISHGLKGYDRTGDELDDEPFGLWHDSYADMYLFIVKLGNEKFEHTILEGELNPTINIGGYGMFC